MSDSFLQILKDLWLSASSSADTPASMEKRERLKSALSKWAIRFNADRVWLMDDALRTLRGWQVAPEWRDSLKWNPFYGHSSSSASTGEAFQFRCEGWETQLLAWTTYSHSVRRRFEEKLLEYEKEIRTLAESCGLVRAQRKHNPENFDWFVLYQFAGWTSAQIARGRYGDDPDSTVRKGIKAAARLIGWGHLRRSGDKRKRKIR